MSNHWEFYLCTMGAHQASIFLDVGLAEQIDSAPDLCLRVVLTYKAPTEVGLPTDEEFEPVGRVEDSLAAFAESRKDWYLGRITTRGQRHFYSSSSADDWSPILSDLSKESGYALELFSNKDPEHDQYFDALYPTPADWQVISDLKTLKAFDNHGDDHSITRQVDHWLYFDSERSCQQMLGWALEAGYTQPDAVEVIDGRQCLRLAHQGTLELADIIHHTIELKEKAEELGGDYDGWEAPVEAAGSG